MSIKNDDLKLGVKKINTIEYAGLLPASCDDGPGIRSVLFLQGCSFNCPHCQNYAIQVHGAGTVIEISSLVEKIVKVCRNKKITISGGEPLEQFDSLVILLQTLKQLHFNVCLYTGFELNRVPAVLFTLVDYLKTGQYVESKRDPALQYVGSSNQQFYHVLPAGHLEKMQLRNESE